MTTGWTFTKGSAGQEVDKDTIIFSNIQNVNEAIQYHRKAYKIYKDNGMLKRLFYVGDCTDGNAGAQLLRVPERRDRRGERRL